MKALISCSFVFAYAKSRFSHDAAYMYIYMLIVYILVISRSGFQGRTLVLIVSVPDQCYYFTFSKTDPIRCISYDN